MADPSYNYSYTPTIDHREANLYREEYYSSTDTKIYMDDDEQTEIGYIAYELQEQLKPVYGYNSRTFDDVVIGNRIVTGQFTVPIKNKAKQEWEISNNTKKSEDKIKSGVSQYNYNEENNLYDTDWFGSTKRNIDRHNNTNINSEYLTKLIALGYDINTNSNTHKYTSVLKQFQNEHYLTASGILNNATKDRIDFEFNRMSAKSVNLDGATGYMDLAQTKGSKKLSGNGIILNTIKTTDGNVYKVIDSSGNEYYVKGIIL